MKKETWLPCAFFYEVSDFGNVRSLPRNNQKKTVVLKPQVAKRGGYLIVTLKFSPDRLTIPVHRLVAKAFLSNTNFLPEVNHKDGNKLNNTVENLEWCTRAQNMKHSYDSGLNKPNKTINAKPVMAVKIENKEEATFVSVREAGRVLNIHSQNICAVLKGKYKKTNGYTFTYVKKIRTAES